MNQAIFWPKKLSENISSSQFFQIFMKTLFFNYFRITSMVKNTTGFNGAVTHCKQCFNYQMLAWEALYSCSFQRFQAENFDLAQKIDLWPIFSSENPNNNFTYNELIGVLVTCCTYTMVNLSTFVLCKLFGCRRVFKKWAFSLNNKVEK